MISSNSTKTNVLATLGILFTLGGTARLLPQTLASAESPAEASETNETPDAELTSGEDNTPEKSSSASYPEPVGYTDPEAVCLTESAAASFTADRDLVASEKATLQQEKLDLKAWETELESLATELEALRGTLNQKWQDMQAASDEDLKHLAQMYGSMNPTQAAEIFNKMDSAFAAGFLRMINTEQAGLILAGMETQRAYVVSVEMANKNSDIRALKD